jgi:hypothetical protein
MTSRIRKYRDENMKDTIMWFTSDDHGRISKHVYDYTCLNKHRFDVDWTLVYVPIR